MGSVGSAQGQRGVSVGATWGQRRVSVGMAWFQRVPSAGTAGHSAGRCGDTHLEEGDGGAVAHAEQEERDEDGDGGPQPIQLPVLVLRTAVVQEQLWTGRERSVPCLPIGVVPGVTVAALRSLRAPASVPPSSRLGPARGDALPLCSALCWGCLGGRQPDHHTRSPGDPAQRVGGSAEPREGSRGWQGVTLANEWMRVSGQLGVGVLVCVGRGPSVLGRRRAGQRGRRVDGLLSSRWVWEGVGTRLGSTVRVPKPGSGLGPGTLSRVRPSVCVCVCVFVKVALLSGRGLFSASLWVSGMVPPLGTQDCLPLPVWGTGVSVPTSGQAWPQAG